jgi:hypothetical protein
VSFWGQYDRKILFSTFGIIVWYEICQLSGEGARNIFGGNQLKTVFLLIFMSMSLNAHAYVEEKVQFTTEDGLPLSGYFAKSTNSTTSPALVIQLGSGKGTTDSETRPYNPLAEIARKIADQGFAVLRFDKRGTGYNSTNSSFADSAFDDYVADFKAAVRYMQGRKDVSNKSLFYMSHSLGGPVIATAAADIAPTGIILSASPGRRYSEYNIEQLGYLYKYGEKITGQDLVKKLNEDRKFNSLLDDPEKACLQYPEHCTKKGTKVLIDGQNTEFWKQIGRIDPIALVKKLRCPVFVVNGTSDWVISSENDAKAIYSSLNPNKNNRLKIINKLDHFFSITPSKQSSVESFLKAGRGAPAAMKMPPALIGELKEWLRLFSGK